MIQKTDLLLEDLVKVVLKTLVVTIVIAFLFYRSLWGFLGTPLVFAILYKREKHKKELEKRKSLQQEFLNGIKILNSAIQAGFSLENAWGEVEKELGLMYGESSIFRREVREIRNGISLNIPVEKLMLEFAYDTGIEDIIGFSQVLDFCKKSGGNWKKIIDTTVLRMSEKEEARREIQVLIAEKKMEQQVMNVLPLGILLFLQLSAWDYMQVLYHNPVGIACMTIGLTGYVGAFFLSEKIMAIEV